MELDLPEDAKAGEEVSIQITVTHEGEPVNDADEVQSPEEAFSRAQLVEHVRAAIGNLPDAERKLLERHYFGDVTMDEAARELGLSKSWGSRLHARALDAADASDQNSYTVTQAFADQWNLTDIASLKNVTDPIVLGGNSELQTRPYGPDALQSKYGITTTFQAIEDSGGSTTVDALASNQIQMANIYTADPNIESNDLLPLADPDGLFVADNVVPIVSDKVDDDAAEIINGVSAKLTADDLVALNSESVNEQKSAAAIATEWLTSAGLIG